MFVPAPLPPPDLDSTEAVWIPVRSGTVFVEPGAGLVRAAEAPIDAPNAFLGVLDGLAVYAIDLHDISEEADLDPVHLRKLFGRISAQP